MTSLEALKESVEAFEEINYREVAVARNEQSYAITADFIETEVARLLDMYRSLTTLDQRARLIRDGIDLYLRRGHGYSIEGNIGAHYRQVGVSVDQCDFEHVIPQAKIRDLLIQGRITIQQAMNPPTCYIEKTHHSALKQAGWASRTPSYWHFFNRYTNVFTAKFETFNGQAVNPHTWTLGEHYKFFEIL